MKTKTYRVLGAEGMKAVEVKTAVNAAMSQLGLIEIGAGKNKPEAVKAGKGYYKYNSVADTLEVCSDYAYTEIITNVQRENLTCKLLVSAYAKHIRISPRKVQIVLDLVRGKDTEKALAILKNTRRGASEYLIKLLDSAVANAENNFHLDASRLYVAECFVTPGPTMKRLMPRAKGSADRILKRTSHVTIVVAERD